eukprot:10841236-Heterocapsa_arctica.AAC.1
MALSVQPKEEPIVTDEELEVLRKGPSEGQHINRQWRKSSRDRVAEAGRNQQEDQGHPQARRGRQHRTPP